jgi:hypothetical protein
MLAARDKVDATRDFVKVTIENLNESRSIIDNADSIVKKVDGLTQGPVTHKLVRSVLKEELGMCYRKIKTVSLHSNSEKNLVLRQRWAIEFLNLARKKKIFLNVDETWLGMSDFRRMKW